MTLTMVKYHGLGNDYLVAKACDLPHSLTEENIRLICSQHYGAGSDGILTGPYLPASKDFEQIRQYANASQAEAAKCLCALRILNPDGSEAEKSGNGLRIFSRFLYDIGMVKLNEPFYLLTLGGIVCSTVIEPRTKIRVDMGKVAFTSKDFPQQQAADSTLKFDICNRELEYCCASVGNPHCVVIGTAADDATANTYGPHIETNQLFPNRINVQFMKPLNEHAIYMTIWERGAGYTLASGSSASAAASVAKRLGYCKSPIDVNMPGGVLHVEISDDWEIVQTGPVEIVYSLEWLGEL